MMPTAINAALIANALSWLFIVLGSFFLIVSAFGVVRMPDLYTRMHAASVGDTLGAGFLIAGMLLQAGPNLIAVKLIFIGALLFITGPVATHALAQAALHDGVEPKLSDDRRERAIDDTGGTEAKLKQESAS